MGRGKTDRNRERGEIDYQVESVECQPFIRRGRGRRKNELIQGAHNNIIIHVDGSTMENDAFDATM